MKPLQIKDGIYWVGALDWDMREFHGYATPFGSTYNAVLVQDEATVLFDTVKKPFAGEFIADGNGTHALFDPVIRIPLGLVDGAGAFGGKFGVFDLLNPFIADFGKPAFEGFGLVPPARRSHPPRRV